MEVPRRARAAAAKQLDALAHGEVAPQVLRNLRPQLQIIDDDETAFGLVLPHGAGGPGHGLAPR